MMETSPESHETGLTPAPHSAVDVPAPETESRESPAKRLLQLALVPHLDPSKSRESDKEARAAFTGVALVCFKFLDAAGESQLFDAITEYVKETGGTNANAMPRALDFLILWVSYGRKLEADLLRRMQVWAESCKDSKSRQLCVETILNERNFFSPVVGRWMTPISPRSSMLAWMEWSADQVATALTAMCLPFFRLRACEFDEKVPGKHLKDLNTRHRVVSHFVVASVLTTLNSSKSQGLKCVDHWLEVSHRLRKMHNWHMLFALQNAFQKHQLDRLTDLWSSLTRKQMKRKKYMEDLFSATNKMAQLLTEQRQCLGRVPMIPCIFWLVQKATLLQEAPLHADDGSINIQHFVAANNVFEEMHQCQQLPYKPSELVEDEVLWYFLRLERLPVSSEDELYVLSDAARDKMAAKRTQRLSVSSMQGWVADMVSPKKPVSPSSSPRLERAVGNGTVRSRSSFVEPVDARNNSMLDGELHARRSGAEGGTSTPIRRDSMRGSKPMLLGARLSSGNIIEGSVEEKDGSSDAAAAPIVTRPRSFTGGRKKMGDTEEIMDFL